jgi:TPR repeat protein
VLHDRSEVSAADAADVEETTAPPDSAGTDGDMCCAHARLLYETGDVALRAKAERWWRRAAISRDLEAQYSLGVVLHEQATDQSVDEAEHWWRAAASAGHVEAGYNLGVLLDLVGTESARSEALCWWRSAAEAGRPAATNTLGRLPRQ